MHCNPISKFRSGSSLATLQVNVGSIPVPISARNDDILYSCWRASVGVEKICRISLVDTFSKQDKVLLVA